MEDSQYTIYGSSSEAWKGMLEAITAATKSIYWEVYIFVDDEIGDTFFDVLEQQAKAGIDVKLIIDSLGSFWMSRKRTVSLRKAGVDLRFFHERKYRYRGMWKKMITRTHRKVLIVDEHLGFIGGVNVQKHMKEWLDIQVRIEGDVVRSLIREFAKMYVICGGTKEHVKKMLKYKFRVKKDIDDIEFVYDESNTKKRSRTRKKYVEALTKARERVILFSPYYFPDKKFLFALWKARKRGVKVDLIIPFRTDVRLATYAGYALFSLMQKYGVKVHLLDRMMHGKGMVVDDDWAMVGSSNIDQNSFYDTYEANVRFKNKFAVGSIKSIIEGWILTARKLEDIKWEKRGVWQKTKEWIAVKLYRSWFKQ